MAARSGAPTAVMSDSSRKNRSNPAGETLSCTSGNRACILHRVDLASWLDDVAAGTQDDLPIIGPEPDLTIEHDRVLVLSGVDVGRHELKAGRFDADRR